MKQTVSLILLLLNLQFSFSQSTKALTTNGNGNGNGNEILLGKIDKKELTQNSFKTWFNENYNNYLVNKCMTKILEDSLNQYEIKVFMGTWCGDSKREVPRFYKVLDAAKFHENQIQVIAVNRTEEAYKQSPNHEEKGLNIHRVPTFIFYKNGRETNRIVETPVETFERDIYKIIMEKKYKPNYIAANYMHDLLNTKSINSLKLEAPHLVSRLAEFVKGSGELNTFGYCLLRSNQLEKAWYVFDLNTQIFPYKYNVYDSLGEAHFKLKNYNEALKNYYKVLSLKPDDKNATEMIEQIKKIKT